ncbi:hypothetical protein [Planctomonas psychrotolerans]|uniref:hypothetical protein n=1 Tax=Planctomonas psychrotolerans TaxID=2528712 RepID=UPI00123A8AFE|nr:hypothetical protein [Planctomonas psychrotolerans]
MGRAAAVMIGILLGSHGFAGLFIEGEHMLGVFNVDILMDAVYLLSALALLVVGLTQSSAAALRGTLGAVAAVLIGIGLLGLLDRELFGAAPTGFMGPDFLFFFGVGAAAGFSALLPRITEPLTTGGTAIN